MISWWEHCAPTLAIHWARRPQALGRLGEQLAARHLAAMGWTVLGRAVKTPFAEIDLVCLEDDRLVCVEVKTGRIRTDRPLRILPRDRLRPRRLRCQERAARHLAQRYRLPLHRCRVDLFEWSLCRAHRSAWPRLQGTHLRDVIHCSSSRSGEPF